MPFGHAHLTFYRNKSVYILSANDSPPLSVSYKKGPEPLLGSGPVLRVNATYVTAAPGENPHVIRLTIIMRVAS